MRDGEALIAEDGQYERRDVYSIAVGIVIARNELKRSGIWGESGRNRSYTAIKHLCLLMPWREWAFVPEER